MVNKCESPKCELNAAEFYALGIAEYLTVSAAHKLGIKELAKKIYKELGISSTEEVLPIVEDPDAKKMIKVAVLGQPNVGKSSLINRILGEDRLVTASVPGTTVDPIDITIKRDGQVFSIVDTAGLRRENKVGDLTVERYGNIRSVKALAECDVALLVFDANEDIPSNQDIKLAQLAHERGRGIIIVINKWDLLEKTNQTVKEFEEVVRARLSFISYAPMLFVSATTGQRCPKILDTVREVYEASKQRLPTSLVNKVVAQAFAKRSPGVYRAEPIRCYYASQVDVSPPRFMLMLNHPSKVNPAYQRYLKATFREHLPFTGNDVCLVLKKKGTQSRKARDEEKAAGHPA